VSTAGLGGDVASGVDGLGDSSVRSIVFRAVEVVVPA
jgi:hypothetical protein